MKKAAFSDLAQERSYCIMSIWKRPFETIKKIPKSFSRFSRKQIRVICSNQNWPDFRTHDRRTGYQKLWVILGVNKCLSVLVYFFAISDVAATYVTYRDCLSSRSIIHMTDKWCEIDDHMKFNGTDTMFDIIISVMITYDDNLHYVWYSEKRYAHTGHRLR